VNKQLNGKLRSTIFAFFQLFSSLLFLVPCCDLWFFAIGFLVIKCLLTCLCYVDCETLIVNRKTPMEHDASEWDVDAGFVSISEWVLVIAA
jgi:hypothetical protein